MTASLWAVTTWLQLSVSPSSILSILEPVCFRDMFFSDATGATRSKSNEELLYARQHTVAVARAYDLDAIDIVNINFREPELLKAEAEQGTVSLSLCLF